MAGKRAGLDSQAGGLAGGLGGDRWRSSLEVEEGIG